MRRSLRTAVLGLLFLLLSALVAAPAVPSPVAAAPAQPTLHWERVSPLPHTADLLGVAYGSDRYVAVGKYGTILSSSDGATWAPIPTGTDHHLTAVTYGDGQFVALGRTGAGLTSPDGETWTLHATHLTAEPLDIAYGNGRYVAVGLGGWTGTSVDGHTWRNGNTSSYSDLRGIAFGAGRFIAVGANGRLLTSKDGESWEAVRLDVWADLYDVAYGDGEFLAVGAPGAVLRSSDGIHWNARTQTTADIPVFFAGGRVVAEDDGRSDAPPAPGWTRGYEARPVDFYRVAYGTNGFVVADSTRYFTTADGVSWKPHYSPETAPAWPYLAFGNGRYVAVGWFGQTAVSTDGVQWRQPAGRQVWLNRVLFRGGRYVAVGRDGQRRGFLMTSTDGKDWECQTVEGVGELRDVAYTPRLYVAAGDGILTSTDGRTWVRRVAPAGDPLDYYAGVAYGNGRFVAVGNTRDVLTSPDGLTWTRHSNREISALAGLAFGNGQFVAFGPGLPEFFTSEDGVKWEKHPLPAGYSLWNVAYGAGAFVFIAHDGRSNLLLTTRNFRTFTEARPVSQEFEALDAVTYADGRFVAVGDRSGMAVSADGVDWQMVPYAGEQLSLVAAGEGRILGLTYRGSAWVSRPSPPADAVLSSVTARPYILPWQEAVIVVALRDATGMGLPGRRIVVEETPTGYRTEGLTDRNGNAYLVVSGQSGQSYRVWVVDDQLYLAETVTAPFRR